MQINPYLYFNGQCAEAFKVYEQVLGGKITSMTTYAETPGGAHVAPEYQNGIIHASLTVGENVIMGSDTPGDMFKQPQGFSVSLGINDPAEAERVYHALAENGTVVMAIEETFWALRFGMLVDRFGTPWIINCEKPA